MGCHYGVWKINLNKVVIKTVNAPKALGVYSQGIKSDDFIYTSGQIGINPRTDSMEQDDILIEIKQVLENIRGILEEGGSSLNAIIKLTVFLTDIDYFKDVNNVFNEYFSENPPARSAVEVSALPMGARVEIEAIGRIE